MILLKQASNFRYSQGSYAESPGVLHLIDQATKTKILQEFDSKREHFESLTSTFAALVTTLLHEAKTQVHSVNGRCKLPESLERKLTLPDKSYTSLSDITDLAGLRITTYFEDDVDAVGEILEREFTIIPEKSVDKRKLLDPDRFGYQSLHIIVEIPPQRSQLPEYKRFSGMQFEIQVRSILQHAWAEIEHDLGYKSAAGIPSNVRRRFARVASLLELADAEFASIRNDLASYSKKIREEISSDEYEIELNLASLHAIYDVDSQLSNLDTIIVTVGDSILTPSRSILTDFIIKQLQSFGINSIRQLEDLARKEKSVIKKFAKYWLRGKKNQAFGTGIGLFYLIFVLLWRSGDKLLIESHFKAYISGEPGEITESIDRLIAFREF